MNASDQSAIIVLAAGESARMGQPKQLLPFNGKTLLRHAVEGALSTDIGPVIVVLGAFSEQIEKELYDLLVEKVINPDWQQGMGTSIRKGIAEVQRKYPNCRGAIIMLADQPYADANLLMKLLDIHYTSHKPIVASAYKGILGVPAYFHHRCFTWLTQLDGQAGARKLIQQQMAEVEAMDFPLGEIDIDTPEDYVRVKKLVN